MLARVRAGRPERLVLKPYAPLGLRHNVSEETPFARPPRVGLRERLAEEHARTARVTLHEASVLLLVARQDCRSARGGPLRAHVVRLALQSLRRQLVEEGIERFDRLVEQDPLSILGRKERMLDQAEGDRARLSPFEECARRHAALHGGLAVALSAALLRVERQAHGDHTREERVKNRLRAPESPSPVGPATLALDGASVQQPPCGLARDRDKGVRELLSLMLLDPSVSKVHASIDVRGDRLFVCDVRSTNGTFTRTGRLDPDRWTDVGAAEEENEIRLGGWHVYLRARRAPAANRGPAPTTGTVIEPLPFGASQSRTSVGSPAMPALLTSFPAVVDRLSEPAHAARLAVAALERAVAHEIATADDADRPALVDALREHYPQLRPSIAPAPPPPSRTSARTSVTTEPVASSLVEALSFASMQELSSWYVDAHTTLASADDIVAFKGRLKAGMDAFVLGMIQTISGLDTYVQQMQIAPDASGSAYPRNASEFARVVFDWRDGTGDGAAIIRRAFMDLSIHQVAFFNAVCFGIRELLHELAPETIESACSAKLAQRGFWGRFVARFAGPRDFLEAYRRRYTDLATEESAHFALIFGPKFAEEYRSFVQETRASSTQAYAAPQTSHDARGGRGGTVPLAPGLAEPSPAPPVRGGTVPLEPGLREDDSPRGRRP